MARAVEVPGIVASLGLGGREEGALFGGEVSEPRELELEGGLAARLVGPRRLAGRADEQPGEQVGQRGVVVPVGDQAGEQIGAAT